MDTFGLPPVWAQILGGADLSVMFGIGVVAFILERATRVSDGIAVLIPLGLGLAWGCFEATQAGYAPVALIFKGALFNGGAASICARGLAFILRKWWDAGQPTDKANVLGADGA